MLIVPVVGLLMCLVAASLYAFEVVDDFKNKTKGWHTLGFALFTYFYIGGAGWCFMTIVALLTSPGAS